MIKYKGQTSALLSDLCMELNTQVDLKASEEIFKAFFQMLLKDLSAEQSIEFISSLPTCVKPFCTIAQKQWRDNENGIKVHFDKSARFPYGALPQLVGEAKIRVTLKALLNVLSKYVSPQSIALIYTSIPDDYYYGPATSGYRRMAI